MSAQLPEFIDPFYFAEKQRQYNGEIGLAKLLRLDANVKNLDDSVDFQLNFSKIGKLSTVQGLVRAKIQLECQNCLRLLEFEINTDVKLAIIQSDQEAALIPKGYEPLLCKQENINFTDIIEDEIILSLPAIPRHDYACFAGQQTETTNNHNRQSGKDSPFSVLATIKKTGVK